MYYVIYWSGGAKPASRLKFRRAPPLWEASWEDCSVDGGVPPMSVLGPAAPGNAKSRSFHENRNFSQKVLNFMKSA